MRYILWLTLLVAPVALAQEDGGVVVTPVDAPVVTDGGVPVLTQLAADYKCLDAPPPVVQADGNISITPERDKRVGCALAGCKRERDGCCAQLEKVTISPLTLVGVVIGAVATAIAAVFGACKTGAINCKP